MAEHFHYQQEDVLLSRQPFVPVVVTTFPRPPVAPSEAQNLHFEEKLSQRRTIRTYYYLSCFHTLLAIIGVVAVYSFLGSSTPNGGAERSPAVEYSNSRSGVVALIASISISLVLAVDFLSDIVLTKKVVTKARAGGSFYPWQLKSLFIFSSCTGGNQDFIRCCPRFLLGIKAEQISQGLVLGALVIPSLIVAADFDDDVRRVEALIGAIASRNILYFCTCVYCLSNIFWDELPCHLRSLSITALVVFGEILVAVGSTHQPRPTSTDKTCTQLGTVLYLSGVIMLVVYTTYYLVVETGKHWNPFGGKLIEKPPTVTKENVLLLAQALCLLLWLIIINSKLFYKEANATTFFSVTLTGFSADFYNLHWYASIVLSLCIGAISMTFARYRGTTLPLPSLQERGALQKLQVPLETMRRNLETFCSETHTVDTISNTGQQTLYNVYAACNRAILLLEDFMDGDGGDGGSSVNIKNTRRLAMRDDTGEETPPGGESATEPNVISVPGGVMQRLSPESSVHPFPRSPQYIEDFRSGGHDQANSNMPNAGVNARPSDADEARDACDIRDVRIRVERFSQEAMMSEESKGADDDTENPQGRSAALLARLRRGLGSESQSQPGASIQSFCSKHSSQRTLSSSSRTLNQINEEGISGGFQDVEAGITTPCGCGSPATFAPLLTTVPVRNSPQAPPPNIQIRRPLWEGMFAKKIDPGCHPHPPLSSTNKDAFSKLEIGGRVFNPENTAFNRVLKHHRPSVHSNVSSRDSVDLLLATKVRVLRGQPLTPSQLMRHPKTDSTAFVPRIAGPHLSPFRLPPAPALPVLQRPAPLLPSTSFSGMSISDLTQSTAISRRNSLASMRRLSYQDGGLRMLSRTDEDGDDEDIDEYDGYDEYDDNLDEQTYTSYGVEQQLEVQMCHHDPSSVCEAVALPEKMAPRGSIHSLGGSSYASYGDSALVELQDPQTVGLKMAGSAAVAATSSSDLQSLPSCGDSYTSYAPSATVLIPQPESSSNHQHLPPLPHNGVDTGASSGGHPLPPITRDQRPDRQRVHHRAHPAQVERSLGGIPPVEPLQIIACIADCLGTDNRRAESSSITFHDVEVLDVFEPQTARPLSSSIDRRRVTEAVSRMPTGERTAYTRTVLASTVGGFKSIAISGGACFELPQALVSSIPRPLAYSSSLRPMRAGNALGDVQTVQKDVHLQHNEFCWRLLGRLRCDLNAAVETYELLLSSMNNSFMVQGRLHELQGYIHVVQRLAAKAYDSTNFMVDYLVLVQRSTGGFEKYSFSAAMEKSSREDGDNDNGRSYDRGSVSSFDDSIAPGYGYTTRSSSGRSVCIR